MLKQKLDNGNLFVHRNRRLYLALTSLSKWYRCRKICVEHPNSQCYQIQKNYVPKWKATAGNSIQAKEKVEQGKQFKDLAGTVPCSICYSCLPSHHVSKACRCGLILKPRFRKFTFNLNHSNSFSLTDLGPQIEGNITQVWSQPEAGSLCLCRTFWRVLHKETGCIALFLFYSLPLAASF